MRERAGQHTSKTTNEWWTHEVGGVDGDSDGGLDSGAEAARGERGSVPAAEEGQDDDVRLGVADGEDTGVVDLSLDEGGVLRRSQSAGARARRGRRRRLTSR